MNKAIQSILVHERLSQDELLRIFFFRFKDDFDLLNCVLFLSLLLDLTSHSISLLSSNKRSLIIIVGAWNELEVLFS